MATSRAIPLSRAARRHRPPAAFSLVEVTLAIGIVAFAFMTIFGLLPTGMKTFRQAMDTTVGGQIAQLVINEAQQSDFSTLVTDSTGAAISGANATGRKQVRYFDAQGEEMVPANPAAPTAAELQHVLYWVNTRILSATATPQIETPAASVNLVTVTVEVAANPANAPLVLPASHFDDQNSPLRNLWAGAPQTSGVVPLTRSTLVSRNQ